MAMKKIMYVVLSMVIAMGTSADYTKNGRRCYEPG